MVQSVKCLPGKHRDLSSITELALRKKKAGRACHVYNCGTGSRDREISVVCWPARLAESVSLRSREILSQKQGEASEMVY